jgi:hypothetical protein
VRFVAVAVDHDPEVPADLTVPNARSRVSIAVTRPVATTGTGGSDLTSMGLRERTAFAKSLESLGTERRSSPCLALERGRGVAEAVCGEHGVLRAAS